MYEYIVLDQHDGFHSEIEWFFNHPDWAADSIPNPQGSDTTRYAILSVFHKH
jgi:hypothetical protein